MTESSSATFDIKRIPMKYGARWLIQWLNAITSPAGESKSNEPIARALRYGPC